jgi:hypothetical protein
MAVRVLLMWLAAFVVLSGCGQASSPVERQEKQGGVEEAKLKEPTEQTAVKAASERTTWDTLFTVSASATADNFFNLPGDQAAAQAEVNCRLGNYISNENMSQQESIDFVHTVEKKAASEAMEDRSQTTGTAVNKVLDDLDVPRYPECKKGGE